MDLAKFSSRSLSSESGFSLLEALIASFLLAGGVLVSAQMFLLATKSNTGSMKTTYAATLAQEKMEQLRGLTWGFDTAGLPVQDFTTNIAVNPPLDNGVGLSPSPDNALAANVDGYVDYIDRDGTTLGGGPQVPQGTVFIRRWSVEPLPSNPNNTLILQVLVFANGGRVEDGEGAVLDRRGQEARLVTVKTRKSR